MTFKGSLIISHAHSPLSGEPNVFGKLRALIQNAILKRAIRLMKSGFAFLCHPERTAEKERRRVERVFAPASRGLDTDSVAKQTVYSSRGDFSKISPLAALGRNDTGGGYLLFNNNSRKQNHAFALAQPCLRVSTLAGKVKPHDFYNGVP